MPSKKAASPHANILLALGVGEEATSQPGLAWPSTPSLGGSSTEHSTQPQRPFIPGDSCSLIKGLVFNPAFPEVLAGLRSWSKIGQHYFLFL